MKAPAAGDLQGIRVLLQQPRDHIVRAMVPVWAAWPAAVLDTEPMAMEVSFTTVLRGYDRGQVDALLRQVNESLASDDLVRREAAAEAVRGATFDVTMRGYDRGQVDDLLRTLPALLVEPGQGPA